MIISYKILLYLPTAQLQVFVVLLFSLDHVNFLYDLPRALPSAL